MDWFIKFLCPDISRIIITHGAFIDTFDFFSQTHFNSEPEEEETKEDTIDKPENAGEAEKENADGKEDKNNECDSAGSKTERIFEWTAILFVPLTIFIR